MSGRRIRAKVPQSLAGQQPKRAARKPQPKHEAGLQDDILSLQHSIGNQAVTQLLQSDADENNVAVSIQDVVENSVGQPLDATTRTEMEALFGHDFSGVQMHTDPQASKSAEALDANAYTSGQDVVFAEGRYAPGTAAGKKLIAHELTHVVQQTAEHPLSQSGEGKSSSAELEATTNSVKAVSGLPAHVSHQVSPSSVQMQKKDDPDMVSLPSLEDRLLDDASPYMASMLGSLTIEQFGLGKADIPRKDELELRRTAQRINKLLVRYGASKVYVTGHTDRVGTEENNAALGRERAGAVKAVLAEEGVPTDVIEADSKGETMPAVETRDEKPEPRNRRVVIYFATRKLPKIDLGLGSELKPPSLLPKPPINLKVPPEKNIPDDNTRPRPELWKSIPPPLKGSTPKSALELFHENVTDRLVKPLVKPFSENVQKWLLEKARDAVEAGVTKGFETAVDKLETDAGTKEMLKKTIEAAIKQKYGQTPEQK
jgi:outer membrane protein OmpA-like peptidoglycan-associated protein